MREHQTSGTLQKQFFILSDWLLINTSNRDALTIL
ncbi:hypothetical protein BVI1335_280032 [Burkholderia vietnamiensis]|nr:hypothetical protein BVI1335_280032 [Burkholderia vietnamiensis]